jgi:outer membrane protein TolC
MGKFLVLISLLPIQALWALDFDVAVKQLKEHDFVSAKLEEASAKKELARQSGSWGDPSLKIAAKNFPKDSFSNDQSPMTGIEFGLMQNIPLSTKYSHQEKAISLSAKAGEYLGYDRYQWLVSELWQQLIDIEKMEQEIQILKENINWVDSILKVSKKLYSNGKGSQQALLEIQIRKSDLETSLSSKEFSLKQAGEKLYYLTGSRSITKTSIPWKNLEITKKQKMDYKELSMQAQLKASKAELRASELNLIPDMSLGFSYTKRHYDDSMGDFVSASVAIALPISSKKYAYKSSALSNQKAALKNYKDFINKKNSQIATLLLEIEKTKAELTSVKDKQITFAKNLRDISTKSYALGSTSYVELLQSELKLQRLQISRVNLEAKLKKSKVALKYLEGEALHE